MLERLSLKKKLSSSNRDVKTYRNIRLYEIKKLLSTPIIGILMIVFILYNCSIIFQNSYIKEELNLANELIDKFGYEVTDEMISELEKEYKEKMVQLNNMTKTRFDKKFSSISEFLDSTEHKTVIYSNEGYSDDELDLLNELNTIEIYKETAINNIKAYEDLDIMEMAQSYINDYELTGDAADLVTKNYSALVERFEELKENKEHKNLYFIGTIYKTHSLLFRKIISKVLLEIMVMVVLMVSFLINYERDNKTIMLVSTTKRGRNVVKDKLIVCTIATILITAIILGITLITYFCVFDYSRVLNVPISSALNWELKPMISYFNFSFLQYLILVCVMTFVIAIIFQGIAFIICSILKSSYKTFFTFFILFGLVFLLPRVISNSSSWLIWSHYNVFVMCLNPHMWLREAGPFLTNRNYELITLTTNATLVLGLGFVCLKRFKREDIS